MSFGANATTFETKEVGWGAKGIIRNEKEFGVNKSCLTNTLGKFKSTYYLL